METILNCNSKTFIYGLNMFGSLVMNLISYFIQNHINTELKDVKKELRGED